MTLALGSGRTLGLEARGGPPWRTQAVQ